jgi:hypothetical protein
MKALVDFLNDGQRQPLDAEVTFTVNTILNRPHQEGIDPRLWFIDYTDIINEIRPSAAVLDCVRKCLRNTAVFAPTPAEFRTALIEAAKTIDRLIADINLLAIKPNEGLQKFEERIRLLKENDCLDQPISELQFALELCYTKLNDQQQITEHSDARQDTIEYFSENAGD